MMDVTGYSLPEQAYCLANALLKITSKLKAHLSKAGIGNMIGQLIHDLGVNELHSGIWKIRRDNLHYLADTGVCCYYIVEFSIPQFLIYDQFQGIDGIAQFQIGAILFPRRAPDSNGLTHYSLPAEFVNGRMKAHADRRPENRTETADNEAQSFRVSHLLQQLFGL